MPDFDVEAFVARLDRMGLKLTSVPLADGKLRINRWRMLNASEHTQQIQDLWARHIGNNQERIDVLAAHLAKAQPRGAADCVSSSPLQIGSESIAVPNAALALDRPQPAGPENASGWNGAVGLQRVAGTTSRGN
jgi:hypothetical protein